MSIFSRKTIAALTVGIALTSASIFSGEKKEHDDETVAWQDVPASVQATITSEAKGGKVEKVEKETEKSAVTYEAKVTLADGTKLEITTDSAGKLITSKKGNEKHEKEDDHDHNEKKGKKE